jgi:hypothetical protein
MERTGMVALERNPQGRIVSMTFLPESADRHSSLNPVRRSIPTGGYYSFEELIDERFWVWSHRSLISRSELREILGPGLEDERQSAEDFLKTVFRAVPLSILRKIELSHTPASRAAVSCSVGPSREKALRRAWKQPKKRRVLSGP